MRDHIGKTLGCKLEAVSFAAPKSFPMFLKNNYSYKKYIIEGQACLFVKPVEFDLAGYKKHRKKIEELTGTKAVLALENITPYQRKILIEENIAFVVENYQIYLPFLAICLSEKYEKKLSADKFAPLTQLVFLYIFYNDPDMTATEISQRLSCTVMSANRAYKTLVDCGLFEYKISGRKKYLVSDKTKPELLKLAEQFMIDPVEKIVYFDKNVNLLKYPKSGKYALSEKTLIDHNEKDICYALTKGEYKNIGGRIDKEQYYFIGGTQAEIWRYSPSVLTSNNTVDDISLIMSMKNETDERIAMEINKLRRKYEW